MTTMNIKQQGMVFANEMVGMFPTLKDGGLVSKENLDDMARRLGMKIPPWMLARQEMPGQFRLKLQTYSPEQIANATVAVRAPAPINAPTQVAASPVSEVKIAVFDHHTPPENFIPEIDDTYVPFGHYDDLNKIIKSNRFAPLYVSGLSGNGKSTMIEQICAKSKKPLIRVNMNSQINEEDLIGSKTLVDGDVQIVEGPVLYAMRNGCVLLIDEIDASNANAILCLQRVLEGKAYFFKMKNELVHPASGFTIIATANTKGKGDDTGRFIGTTILNDAFLERFGATFEQAFPSLKVEEQIIMNKMKREGCEDIAFANTLARYVDGIRKTYFAGGIDELLSTRRVEHIIVQYGIFRNKEKAVKLCVSRFDAEIRDAFIELWKKVDGEDAAPKAAPQPTTQPGQEIPF